MAYSNPTRGGRSLSYNGKTVGVWFMDAGNDMTALCVMEAVAAGQWEARWNSGFNTSASYAQQIADAGGEVAWIKKYIAQINAALSQLFGVAPLPPAVSVADKVNDAIANSFTLTAGPTAPVFGVRI